MQIIQLCVFLVLAIGSRCAVPNYHRCELSVVGAGWGGAYFAYRVAQSGVIDAENICIFEQSYNRVGGRTYSYGNPSEWEDLKVDLGAYRYPNSQQIIKGIAESILNASVTCYGGPCTDTTGYRVYVDQYDNNAGYATGIEGLLDKFVALGGQDVFLNHKLVNVAHSGGPRPIKLVFQKGSQTVNVKSAKAFLNIHSSAIKELQASGNLLFSQSNYTTAALKAAVDIPTVKQYVWYEDAWWLTKLNYTIGGTSAWGALPPVSDLRFHDGPVKCYKMVGGQRQYFNHRVAGGADGSKCYGALMNAYVSFDDASYNYYVDNWVTPAEKAAGTHVIFIKKGDSREALLNATHASIMNALGLDFSAYDPPTSTVFSLWNSHYNPLNPSFFVNLEDVQSGVYTPDSAYSLNTLVMKPVENRDIYVASEAYGISLGWAEGSLIMVERILASYFGLSRPSYVSQLYWNQNVLPYLPHVRDCTADSDCKSTNNCVVGVCDIPVAQPTGKGKWKQPPTQPTSGKCVWETRTNEPCSQSDSCHTDTICSYTGMCYGPNKVCLAPTDVCVGGTCRDSTPPPMPACHYSNAFGPFNLWWEFAGDEIKMVYQMPGNSYTAFGIGSSMMGADIIVSFTQSDGQRYVRDYYSAQAGAPSLDTDVGGTNDLTDVFIASDGWGQPSKTWFTRKLNTGDSKDQVIVNGTMNFIYAFGEEGLAGQLQYHGANRNQITVDLSQCTP